MCSQKIIVIEKDGFSYFDRPAQLNSSAWTFVHIHRKIVKIQTLEEIIKIKRSPTTKDLLKFL